jgi:hypothetical protein
VFGNKEKPSYLFMERFGPTNSFQLSVISDEFKTFQPGETLWIKFGDGERRRIEGALSGKSTTGSMALFLGHHSLAPAANDPLDPWRTPVTPAMEAAAKSISVTRMTRERIFLTGPLDKAFAALRNCTDDLVSSWGFDPVQQAQLARRPEPIGSPATWLRTSDYPQAMIKGGKQAQINFRLSIGADGAPTACEVQRSYNDKTFDEVTCTILMRRARFSPAVDPSGQAVASYYLNTVRWVL